MPEFFLELFSEEIPARMQARAAEELSRMLGEALAALGPREVRSFYGPRRIAVAAEVAGSVAESRSSERGPRRTAPEQALAGFLRKHGAAREELREEGDFWVLDKLVPGVDAAALIAEALPGVLRRFGWPKSMRWGGTSAFTWVRPLRRILCLLDGAVVRFDLRDGADDGHGLASGDLTEGHRFLSPGAFAVSSRADWAEKLRARHVIVDAGERRTLIADGLRDLAATRGLAVVDDPGLLDEVAGLVEWPVPLIGAIDAAYMDLPPEVMQVSMRVNQRYFALRDAFGAAPFFAFVANIAAGDGGATIIAGNERVLRARFADARHFWDLDRTRTLDRRVDALDSVTFHARLGSQGDRRRRLEWLAPVVAPYAHADCHLAARAGRLAKADLTTGMVGEFPDLQGVMGGYYALHDEEESCVADAIRDHYAPKGPSDVIPEHPIAIAVALADKFDMIVGLFSIGEKPTGSGDPYALRRAALGVIRILDEKKLRLPLREIVILSLANYLLQSINKHHDMIDYICRESGKQAYIWGDELDMLRTFGIHAAFAPVIWDREFDSPEGGIPSRYDEERFEDLQFIRNLVTNVRGLPLDQAIGVLRDVIVDRAMAALVNPVVEFVFERLRVQLRARGARYDVLNAVLGTGLDDDITRLLARTEAVAEMLDTEDGKNLLAANRRAANILRIEEKKDGPHDRAVDPALLEAAEEIALAGALDRAEPAVTALLGGEDFAQAMTEFAALRPFLDAFFNEVTVNDARGPVRLNRLALLARVRAVMGRVADFSRIEG